MEDKRRQSTHGGHQSPGAGVISTLELYTIEEAKRRLRWTESAFRAAKTRGLTLLVCGKRRYVTGREILRFLEAGVHTAAEIPSAR